MIVWAVLNKKIVSFDIVVNTYAIDSDYLLQNTFTFNENLWLLVFWIILYILRNYCNIKSN